MLNFAIMDKATSNKKDVFTINCRDIPETICVETRFLTLAAAKQKKYEPLFYLFGKDGQLALSNNEDQFLAYKNSKNIPKQTTVTVSLQQATPPTVPPPSIVHQPHITTAAAPLTVVPTIRPVPISKLSNNITKMNALSNTANLPRITAVPTTTLTQMPFNNTTTNTVQTTKPFETTTSYCSRRSLKDNIQQTEISAFKLKSIGIQCKLSEENEDLDINWPTNVQEESCENVEIDNMEIAKEKYLKFVQENSTQHKNSFKECLICGEICKSNKYFYTHMAAHQGSKVLCFKCGFSFNNEDLLRKHNCRKTKLTNKIHLKCPHYSCGVTAISRLELYDHMNEHSNYRPYKCTGCRKAFFTRQEFLRHILIRE